MFALYLYSAPAAFAQCDDGSIELNISFEYDNYPDETSWYLLDASGAAILSVYDGGAFDDYYQCVADGACYTLVVEDYWGDGGPAYTVSSPEHGVMVSGSLLSGEYAESNFFCAGEVAIPGCTSEVALNFDANATEDDGSCEYVEPSCETTGNFCYENDAVEVVGYAASPGSTLYLQFLTGAIETCCDELYVFSSFDLSPENLLYEDLNQAIPGTVISSPTGLVVIVIDSDGSWSCSSGQISPAISWVATCEIEGCGDPDASNYDPNVTFDDGTCEYNGCTDSAAFNYDPAATTDDGSCELPSCSWSGEFCYDSGMSFAIVGYAVAPEGENINLLFEQGNIEDYWDQIYVVDGFDLSTANVLWSAGTVSVWGYEDFSGTFITSTTGIAVIVINSDNSASCVSSSDLNPIIWSAFCDAQMGCTDSIACNYDESYVFDDGSCDYSCIGCMQTNAANYDPTATIELEGSCVFCAAGTFPLTVSMTDAGGDGWNGATYNLQAIDGSANESGSADDAQSAAGGIYTDFVCANLGCYIFSHGGGTADGENSVTLSDQFGTVYVTDLAADVIYGLDFGLFGQCGFEGCTDSGCFNFDPSATIDDGSCICPPDNNAIANAQPIACGMTLSGDLSNASDPDGLVAQYGDPDDPAAFSPGVWYSFNASGTDQVDVNTCGTATSGLADVASDTKLHIFKQDSDGSLELVTLNNNECGLYSAASFLTQPGENYLIHIARNTDSGVQFELALDCSDCPETPSNDFCVDAIPMVDGITFSGNTCCTNPTGAYDEWADHQGVWFTMNSQDPVEGLTFSTFSFSIVNVSGESVALHVYDSNGTCDSLQIVAGCVVAGICAGSVEEALVLEPNTDYYFYAATATGADCGDFEFTTTGVYLGCTDPVADNYWDLADVDDGSCTYSIVPDNDACENAAPLACGDFIEASMGGATYTEIESCFPVSGGCTTAPYGQWPSNTYTPFCNGSLGLVTSCGYAGEYSRINCIEDETYLFQLENQDIVTAALEDGTILATGTGFCEFTSPISGIVRFYQTPPGNCGGAVSGCVERYVACGDYTPPAGGVTPAGGVWYTFEGTGELHNINTCGSTIDTKLALFTAESATACGSLSCATDASGEAIMSLTSFDDCGFFDQDDASLNFISEIGTTYFVYVSYEYDGTYNGQGDYNISMTCEEVVEGCSIGAACNYNADVNVETNEVCEYTSCVCADAGNPDGVVLRIEMFDFNGLGGDGWATSDPGSTGGGYTITDQAGNVVATGSIDDALYQLAEDNFAGAEFGVDAVCIDPGCYNYSFTTATFWGEEQYWAVYEGDGTEAVISVDLGAYAGLPSETTTDYDFGVGGAVCGCTDTGACNYDELATDDDGSCEYLTCAGCTDETSCLYDPAALILDLAACCYDNCVTVNLTSGTSAVVTISDLNGDTIESINVSSDDASYTACVAQGCYIVSSEGAGNWTMSGIFGLAITGGADFDPTYFSVGGSNCVYGCNVLAACNYDATANILVISTCSFDDCAGCTYDFASNYYPLDSEGNPITEGFVPPSVDDGSCVFDLSNPCPADINQDGYINTGDLLVFLGAFGTVCD
jgi:hypothetical protein